MYTLRDHRTAPRHKNSNNRMDFQQPIAQHLITHHSTHNTILAPLGFAQVHACSHTAHDAEAGGYGKALEVLGFSRSVFRKGRHSDVEPCEPGQTAKYEEGKEERVKRGPEAESECCCCWCYTERDLRKGSV